MALGCKDPASTIVYMEGVKIMSRRIRFKIDYTKCAKGQQPAIKRQPCHE